MTDVHWYKRAYCSEVVAKLRETPGRKEKEEILRIAIEHTKSFREFLVATYNPLVNYYILKIPAYRPAKDFEDFSLQNLFVQKRLDILSNRIKTGKEAEKHLIFLLESLNSWDAEALEMIIQRDIRAGVNAGLINHVAPGLIPVYPCMLCERWDEKLALKMHYPAISQIKMDGARGNIVVRGGNVQTFSRNGKTMGLDDLFSNLGAEKSNSFVLDGEFLCVGPNGDLPRKIGNGILNKCAKGTATPEERACVRFVCWDILGYDEFSRGEGVHPYSTRLNSLREALRILKDPRLSVVESRDVGSLQAAREHFQNARERGFEGTILKDPTSKWKDGRSPQQLKMKNISDCDLLVVGLQEGQGKHAGKLGALLCQSSDGLLKVSVGTGFSDQQREELWKNSPIGSIIAVEYNEKIKDREGNISLFLPVFVEIRSDKETADSEPDIK